MKAKDHYGGVFSRQAQGYLKRIEELMDHGDGGGRWAVVEAAKVRRGMRILDVACGPGILTLRLAKELDGEGEVIGIDLAQGMIDVAMRRAGPLPVRFQRMDAEVLQFPAARFDAVTCGHGLQFMPNLGRALREFRRVLKPRGRFVASVPLAARSEADLAAQEALNHRLGAREQPPDLAGTVATVADPDRLQLAVREAGFRVVEVERLEVPVSQPDADAFARLTVAQSSTADRMHTLSPHVRDLVLAEVAAAVRKVVGEGPVEAPGGALLVRAEA
ncbi:MAG: hypothetical protein NVS9B1_09680 [Candidatus Dormibacteraceae bacterium]